MNMTQGDIIWLWDGGAPGFDPSIADQAQPSVKAFPVPGSRGAVVVCPGGGYVMKAAHEGDPIALMLNRAGVSAYVLDYRVAPYTYPWPIEDGLRAVRVVRSLGYEKVGILGFSAGGHLSCAVATLGDGGDSNSGDPVGRYASRPDAFAPCYAVVSLEMFRHQGSLNSLLGEHAGDDTLLSKLSADQNITSSTPPAFIWHTADDDVVPVQNSLMLASTLGDKGVPYELIVFPSGRHGLGLGEPGSDVAQWPALCQKWLIDLGFA